MERAVWYTANEMVKRGHEVTLVGGDGSKLDGATVIPYNGLHNFIPWLRENKSKYDILHDFSHDMAISAALKGEMKCLSTLENPNDPKDAPNVVTVSQFHRRYTWDYYARDTKVVYNAVDTAHYPFYPNKRQDYVFQMGVVESRKGTLEVLKYAKQAGVPVYMAGLVSQSKDYQRLVDGYIDGNRVKWFGNVGGKQKQDLMGNAAAMMLVVFWSEPGSYVGPESTCMGTPIICNDVGCVAEYVIPNETGIVVKEESQLAEAMIRVRDIDPYRVREFWLSSPFRASVMGDEYEALYHRVLDGEAW